MARKMFTDESLATLVSEIKSYTDDAVSTKANSSHTHAISDVTNLQSSLDAKAASSHTHTVSQISDLTATAAELNYVDGVTSNIQTQLDAKAASSHTHNYAGSSSAGGSATSAVKLATARTINGVSFDGSANITVPANFGITTAGTGAAYTATVDGITSLTAGASFIMIPHTVSTSTAPTLNVNSLGAKTIRRMVSNSSTSTSVGYNASWLGANKPVRVTYNGTFWIAELTKPSAADMSGTLGIANGGTGATTAAAALDNLGASSRKNLLSNWYFADPVNSAGQKSYAPTNAANTIDQWSVSGASSVVINDDGTITVTATSGSVAFVQSHENTYEAREYTLSFLVTAYSGYAALRFQRTDTWTSVDQTISSTGLVSATTTLDETTYRFGLLLGQGASITVKAAKLELGTVSTLANDPPPNKALERVKCNGAASITKLWENASADSEFAAQTISLDLAGYDMFIVEACANWSDYANCYIGTKDIPLAMNCVVPYSSSTNAAIVEVWARQVTFSDTGATFTDSTYFMHTTNSGTFGVYSSNHVLKPYAIYGIKGVQ